MWQRARAAVHLSIDAVEESLLACGFPSGWTTGKAGPQSSRCRSEQVSSNSSGRTWHGGSLQRAGSLRIRIRDAHAAPPRPRHRRWAPVPAGTGISSLRYETGRRHRASQSAPAAGFRVICSNSSTPPTPSPDGFETEMQRSCRPGPCSAAGPPPREAVPWGR